MIRSPTPFQLSTEPSDVSGSFVQILETYTGLGPIIDMVTVDLTRQGYDQVKCVVAGLWYYSPSSWSHVLGLARKGH